MILFNHVSTILNSDLNLPIIFDFSCLTDGSWTETFFPRKKIIRSNWPTGPSRCAIRTSKQRSIFFWKLQTSEWQNKGNILFKATKIFRMTDFSARSVIRTSKQRSLIFLKLQKKRQNERFLWKECDQNVETKVINLFKATKKMSEWNISLKVVRSKRRNKDHYSF